MEQHFDIAIIGSGFGGLLCAAILSKEGKSVCVIEKNDQLGGCLQTFSRDRITYDTGVHYLGGLKPGQNLYSILNYVGIAERLHLQEMDRSGFDVILFNEDVQEYCYGAGYENFIKTMCSYFPNEENTIKKYCEDMQKVCRQFPLYNLESFDAYKDFSVFEKSAYQYFEELSPNKKLRSVLAGNNMLYIGNEATTPFYIHALITNSYIESAMKCAEGGDQIAKLLARVIRENGGKIFRKKEVLKIEIKNGVATHLKLRNGTPVFAHTFISNIHPAKTFEMLDTDILRNTYKKRIEALKNSVGMFVIYAKLKEKTVAPFNRNYYYFETDDVWNTTQYNQADWPLTYALFSGISKNKTHEESVVLMTYMRFEEVQKWAHTFNTNLNESERAADYQTFKQLKAEKLLKVVAKKFPQIVRNIESYTTSTPLSFRDYINTPEGSSYGIAKDFNDPIKTRMMPNTKISNLFLTGQNINLHGILGVAMTSLLTCGILLGKEHLLNKIKAANEKTI